MRLSLEARMERVGIGLVTLIFESENTGDGGIKIGERDG